MFAAHHRLGNLRVVVDVNGQQAFGLTAEVLDISNLGERWAAFGWRVSEVDGHSVYRIAEALSSDVADQRPHVVLARTIFGKGVSYMEQGLPAERENLPIHRINWHYLPMSDREYELALTELQET